MNLVAEESVDRQIVERIRDSAHSVVSISETSPGDPDEVVLLRANELGALLLTADTAFGEFVFRLKKASQGILLIRLAALPSVEKARIVNAVFSVHGDLLRGNFSVVTRQMLRIRSVPELP